MDTNFKKGDQRRYSYKKAITLTFEEGEKLEKILKDNCCENVSQLCKKIANGELEVY